MIAWLEARAWQVGAVVAATAALGLGVSTAVLSFQKVGLERDVARLESDLKSVRGDLRTCQWNTVNLEEAVLEQNEQIREINEQSEARLAEAAAAVDAARGESVRLRKEVTRILSTPATSASVCERVEEIDRAIQEAFR